MITADDGARTRAIPRKKEAAAKSAGMSRSEWIRWALSPD